MIWNPPSSICYGTCFIGGVGQNLAISWVWYAAHSSQNGLSCSLPRGSSRGAKNRRFSGSQPRHLPVLRTI